MDAEKSIHHHWGSAIEVCLFFIYVLGFERNLKDDDFVNPFTEFTDPCVDSRLIGFSTANAPRNDTGQHPMVCIVTVDHHRSATVTLFIAFMELIRVNIKHCVI